MNDELENFGNAPISISEARAEKHQASALWRPRDVLVSMLRDIDNGKIKPESLIVIFDEVDHNLPGQTLTYYYSAVKGFHKAIGMLTFARFLMMNSRNG